MKAGPLRHRITIQQKTQVRDSAGNVSYEWNDLHANIAARVEPLSVKEFVQSKSMQNEVTKRIVIRYIDGLDATMRIVYRNKIYNPEGFLEDLDSGLEYLTIPVSEGLNDGQ